MKTTKKLIALLLGATMLLGLLAACGNTKPTPTVKPNSQVSVLSGMLILSAQASFKIGYDQEGMVMELSGANEDGAALVATYTDFVGKTCNTVVKELLTATADATLLREAKNIVLKLAVGSQLPSETFLEGLAKTASETVADNGATGFVVAIGLDGLDADGYINAENAQNLLKNELGVTAFDSYNGDTAPRDDCYTVYVKAGEIEGSYLIDAVTGLITEVSGDESSEPEYIEEEEFDPSFEDVEQDPADDDVDVEIPEGDPT